MVGLEDRVPNSRLVGPSQLHHSPFIDFIVGVMAVIVSREETDFSIKDRLGISSRIALL